jgi:hypothetical protein
MDNRQRIVVPEITEKCDINQFSSDLENFSRPASGFYSASECLRTKKQH